MSRLNSKERKNFWEDACRIHYDVPHSHGMHIYLPDDRTVRRVYVNWKTSTMFPRALRTLNTKKHEKFLGSSHLKRWNSTYQAFQ